MCVARLSAPPTADVMASRPSEQHTDRASRPWWRPEAVAARAATIRQFHVEIQIRIYGYASHVLRGFPRPPRRMLWLLDRADSTLTAHPDRGGLPRPWQRAATITTI